MKLTSVLFVNCEFFILFESLGKSSIIIIKKIYINRK
ncbi:MAG: hypothetical protein PWQ94_1919 [Thermoanaerobacterium sp.]|nr:hypothetical protein [Thermoanaerobacterium sp.]